MHYHFIAIGGAVMHNLALDLLHQGHTVTGSDDEIFEPAKSRLENVGLLPEKFGWFSNKITLNIDAIILGMHAKADNPELLRAQELNLTIFSFPEFVFHQSQNKKRIVVGGSHGKTTTTAMIMHILQNADIEFDYLVGSLLPGFDRMVKISNAPIIVIEGDEYLTSALLPIPKFHLYKPHISVLTGIAWDHINVFPTYDFYKNQFQLFLEKMEKSAICFYANSDSELKTLNPPNSITYNPYFCPDFEITEKGSLVKIDNNNIALNIIGKHNLENASAAVSVATEFELSKLDAWKYLASFTGTAKRMEKVFEDESNIVIRDFAHAPSKVKATVNAASQFYPNHKIYAFLELHTFSSLNINFMPHYKGTLSESSRAFVFYEPHVFELKRMEIPSLAKVQEAIPDAEIIDNPETLMSTYNSLFNNNEKKVLLMMSSGNFAALELF